MIVYVSGYLAAIAIPSAYFQYFGRQHLTLALTIEEAFVVALPLFLLAVGWTYPSLQPMRAHRWNAMLWCLVGLLAARTISGIYAVMAFIEMPVPEGATKYPVGAFALTLISPWNQPWAYLTTLAAPAGIVVAALLVGGGSQSRALRPGCT